MKRGPYRTKVEPGSVADLVQRFRASPTFLSYAPNTRRTRDAILGDFVAKNGRAMVADLKRGNVVAMRDELAAYPSAANTWLKVIKVLLAYAADLDLVQVNVARDVKRLPIPNPDGHRTWREDEIAAYLAHHPAGSMAHRVFVLALTTAAARVDLVRLGWFNVEGDRIRYRRQKTRKRTQTVVDLPIMPELAALIATLPRDRASFLENRFGEIRSEKALTGAFRRWVDEAGLGAPDENGTRLALHGLRKAMARRLAEAGAPPQEIAAVLGHESLSMAVHYSKAYDRSRASDSGLARLAGGAEKPNVVRLKK